MGASSERPAEVVFGEAGDVMGEFEHDGSDSELEREEEKAAGDDQVDYYIYT